MRKNLIVITKKTIQYKENNTTKKTIQQRKDGALL